MNDKTKQYILLLIVTLIGGGLRFLDLGKNPLWIDEALFGRWARDIIIQQEYPTLLIAHWFGFQSEFWLRFMFALAGTLTIPAVYFVVKNYKIQAATFVSIFPLFIFWSGMARPYAFAGLFMVLGWRYWFFSMISILTTPFGVLGVKIIRQKKWIVLLLVMLAAIVFINRPDFGVAKTVFLFRTRLLYLPVLALLLYVTEYDFDFKFYKKISLRLMIFAAAIITSLAFLPAKKYGEWYSADVQYSDWRNIPPSNFSTNAHTNNWYSGGHAYELKDKFIPLYNKIIERGETIVLTLDYYALTDYYKKYFAPEFLYNYKGRLLNGEVIVLLINKNSTKEFRVKDVK